LKTRSAKLLLLLICVIAPYFLLGQSTRFAKGQLPAVAVFTDAAQTFTSQQTFNNPLKLSSTSTPTVNGEIGFDGTNLKGYHNNAAFTMGAGGVALGDSPTWTGSHLFNNRIAFGTTATVTANGQIGYDGTNLKGYANGASFTISSGGSGVALGDSPTWTGAHTFTSDVSLATNGGATVGLRFLPLRVTTTNTATPQELVTNDAGTGFLPVLSNGDAYQYVVTIAAKGTAGTWMNQTAMFRRSLVIKRVDGGNTQVVSSSLETIVDETAGVWTFAVTADTSNQRPAAKVTGDAASTIKWAGWAQFTKIN